MKILVSSAFDQPGEKTKPESVSFTENRHEESFIQFDLTGLPVKFFVDRTGTSAYSGGISLTLPRHFAVIKSSRQLKLILESHDISVTPAGHLNFHIRPLDSEYGNFQIPGSTKPEKRLADCAGAGCGGVGCGAVGCAAAGTGGGGCAAAGCAAVGCAAAGCAAVGCATVTCAAAGSGSKGCAAAGCAAVACAAAGCAAAACAAVACAAAGCATVACGAATGACGAAACALDALCGANAGWPP